MQKSMGSAGGLSGTHDSRLRICINSQGLSRTMLECGESRWQVSCVPSIVPETEEQQGMRGNNELVTSRGRSLPLYSGVVPLQSPTQNSSCDYLLLLLGFPGGAVGKNPPGMQKTQEM